MWTRAIRSPHHRLARWRGQPMVRHLRLASLDRPSLATMVAEMLHVDQAEAAGLADAIEPRTHGNPYETVELLNALRRDGVLTAAPAGWQWQAEAVRARLDRSEHASLQGTRLRAMPEQTRAAVEAMACLGGRAELSVLRTAAGATADEVADALGPAIEDGLLVLESGARDAVRFRHDRIRETVVAGIPSERRCARSSPWRAGWRRCPSCTRWQRSSTCRLPARSAPLLSGGWWRGCWRARPTRRP